MSVKFKVMFILSRPPRSPEIQFRDVVLLARSFIIEGGETDITLRVGPIISLRWILFQLSERKDEARGNVCRKGLN